MARLRGGVALLCAAPPRYRSRDTEYRYRQDSDFFYLTGVTEPQVVAVLTPHDAEHRFTLFWPRRDPERERWDGPRLGMEEAQRRYGATAIYPLDELEERLPALTARATHLVYSLGSHPALDRWVLERFRQWRRVRPRDAQPWRGVHEPAWILADQRLVKDAGEQQAIATAAAVTVGAIRTAMAHVRPGMGEWEIEAMVEGAMRAAGASGPAFPTIVASGPNATVLHYRANARRIEPGDLVLLDAGAEWDGYAADATRTFPIAGRFSPPQRELYEVVRAALLAARTAVRPGASVQAAHDAAVATLSAGLVDLGLLPGPVDEVRARATYRRFFWHQTSHWVGLDVHDPGPYRRGDQPVRLRPGMVLTVEPGLYVPADADAPSAYRGLGIRLEDTLLVTHDGAEILTGALPIDPDEVEAAVGEAIAQTTR